MPSSSSYIETHPAAAQPDEGVAPTKPQIERLETVENAPHKFVIGKKGGDIALGLVHNVDELFEPFTADEERKVMRKVDLLILPYLAVCYVFFFVCCHFSFCSAPGEPASTQCRDTV